MGIVVESEVALNLNGYIGLEHEVHIKFRDQRDLTELEILEIAFEEVSNRIEQLKKEKV